MDLHVSLMGRRDLAGQIYRQLRAAILDGRLRAGLPDVRLFPYESWRRITAGALRPSALGDPASAGDPAGLPALSEFAVTGPPVRGLVFGYGAVTPPEIGEGLRRLRRFVDG
ncbi:hypothetical protein [Actinomadura sp. 3N407]|uniref:hypothetical protein n=1 Tax=Actinomadura sp. 3N407 TaxID=3457423 RepID=UPI003FCC2D50